MSHIPVNHPLRPFYRVLAAIVGVYVLLFGVVGAITTVGTPLFDQSDTFALGLRTNFAFAIASAIAGPVILLSLFVGRNIDYVVNVWGGVAFMLVGTAMLAPAQQRSECAQLLRADCDRVVRDRDGALLGRALCQVWLDGGGAGRGPGPARRPLSTAATEHGGH